MKYFACIIVLLFQLAGSMLADNTAVRESGAAFYFRNIVTTIGKAFAPFGFRNAELQSNALRVPFKSSGDEPPVMDGGVVAMIEPEPVGEPEPEPKPVVEPEPEPVVEPEPEPKPVVEPEPEPVVEPEPAVEDRVAEPEPAPESLSNSAPDFVDPESMTEEDLFLQLFGIKKPKSMGIDVDARVFLDDMLVGKAIIKSDTNFSFYKISTEKLINYVTPFLKKGVVSDLKKMFAEMEYLDKAALTSAGFSVIFSGARQRLSIKTPVEMRGVQTIDFSKAMFGAYAQNDFETHWFSGYFDINYYSSMAAFPEVNVEFKNDFFQVNNHLAMGPIFMDSEFKKSDLGYEFKYSELNSFLWTDQYFFQAGILRDEQLVGVRINDVFVHSLGDDYRKKTRFSFETTERAVLNVYNNGRLTNSRELYPGKYRAINFPISSGPNIIFVEMVGANTYKSKTIFKYKSNELMEPLDYDFDVQWGVFDLRDSSSLENRMVAARPHTLVSQKVGLFSLNQYAANMTLETEFKTNPSVRFIENHLRFGTPLGIFKTSLAQSQNLDYGIYAQAFKSSVSFLLKEDASLASWQVSFENQAENYLGFSTSAEPILQTSYRSKRTMKVINQMMFKSWRFIKFPFTFSNQFEVNETDIFMSSNQISTGFGYNNVRINFSLFWETHKKTPQSPNHVLTFGLSYNRSEEPLYPINAQVDFSSAESQWVYRNDIPLYKGNNSGVVVEFDQNKNSVMGAYSAYGFVTAGEYASSSTGSSIGLSSSLGNDLLSTSFDTVSQLTGSPENIRNAQNFKLSTSLVFVGNRMGLGQVGEKKAFGIVKKNKLLKGHEIQADNRPIRDVFPAVVTGMVPGQSTSVLLTFDQLPEKADISDLSLDVMPEYGRGYVTTVGKKSNYFVFGTILDADQEPIALQFIEVTGQDNGSVIYGFTNQSGRFEFQADTEQAYEIRVVDYNSKPYIFDLNDTTTNGKTVVNIGKIMLIRELGALDE
ncbi:MAG: carboxypeptidase-like regulatory domain-containing protein [bacterium]|nr:carboxypeptidase-like regulatory domain-containing protein [bacterium]